MSEKVVIDCSGLACPKPVLEAKEALESMPKDGSKELVVIVDNEAARNNVERFLSSQGCKVEIEALGGEKFRLTASVGSGYKERPVEISCTPSPQKGAESIAILFKSDTMGEGDRELGTTLMDAFCHTLLEIRPVPMFMAFYNSGVKLATTGSVVLDALKEFEKQGTQLLVCGTCLRFYGLEDALEVGRVSNMYEILEALTKVTKVIHP